MTQQWAGFFGDANNRAPDGQPYRALIFQAVERGGPFVSIVVDFLDIQKANPAAADELVLRPDAVLTRMSEGIEMHLGAKEPKVHVRITNVPEEATLDISSLREAHLNQLISISGVVQSVSETRGVVLDAMFKCARCGAYVKEEQDSHLLLKTPLECPEEQGGCGRQSKFKLILGKESSQQGTTKGSVLVDTQAFHLQEPPDSTAGTRTPERLACYVRGDWCGRIFPSERVSVNGILRSNIRRVAGKETPVLDYYVDVLSFRTETTTYADIVPTEEEERQIVALSRSETLREQLIGSIAPSIHGRREAKLAILLQLFGGVPKRLPDGQQKRGDIHVLLIGDPGQGKSVLGRAAVQLSPRGQAANALTASVAGIVGGVEKLEKGLGGETWVYSAGLVTLVDRGFLFMDEADKAEDKKLINSLLEPLEQQTVSLNKMGARGLVVGCQFSALFGANPKNGRFDVNADDLSSQIDLPSPLLDRMDLVFILDDQVDRARDDGLLTTVLRGHQYGAALEAQRVGARGYVKTDLRDAQSHLTPVHAVDFLRKYIAHARRTVVPVLTEDAAARIRGKYTLVRSQRGANPNAPTGYSARTIDSLVRLAEGAARMRLSPIIEDEDLDLAFAVFEAGWERLARNSKGELDMDRLSASVPKDMRDVMKRMLSQIDVLVRAHDDGSGAKEEEIMAAAVSSGMTRETALAAMQRMKTNGTLLPRRGGWATTNVEKEVRR